MRSKEFVKEAGRNGSMDDFGQPINQPPTDAEYAARQAQGAKTGAAIKNFFSGTPKELKDAPPGTPIDPYVRARLGYKPYAGETEPGYLLGADGNPVKDGSGQPIRTPNSPIAKAAAMPAYQARDLRDPNSLNRQEPAYADRIPAVKPVEPAPAYVDRIPAVKPVEPAPAPAPVQNADPVPSFRVPGAAQAGQGGTNYTTGVAQDRPHRPDAGADQTTRNDYPFVPYTGPEPKPDVKPKPNPTPIPRRKVPKSVVQVSPDKQNLATTKTTLTPDEIKAAQEALRDQPLVLVTKPTIQNY